MVLKKCGKMLLLCFGLIIFASPAAQALLIDDFTTPAGGQSVGIVNAPPGSAAFSTWVSTNSLGGWRQIGVEVESTLPGSTSIKGQVFPNDTPSNYQLEQSILIDGYGTIQYDANGAGLNENLGGFAGIRLEAAINDLATSYTLTLETFTVGSSSVSVTKPGGFIGNLDFLFSSLVGTANLADIDRIIFKIDPERAGDVYLQKIVTFTTPVPASLLLFGSGLLTLAAALRKKL